MKSFSKFSLTLFSLLALSGISASANQKKNNTTNSNEETVTNQSNSNSDNQTNMNNHQNDSQDTNLKNNSSNLTITNRADYNSQSKKVNQLNYSQKEFNKLPTSNIRKKHHVNTTHYSNSVKHAMNKDSLSTTHVRIHKHHKTVMYRGKRVPTWFIDGLSHKQLRARGWIVHRESGGHWRVLSYGHVCVGRYQLNPGYLGYKHGHVNLGHRHQTIVADRYVRNRYGSWVFAKRFWRSHHWY